LKNKKSNEIFEDILGVKMESSKLINYSTNMCQSGQGTTILVMYVLEAGFYSLNFELHTKFELQNAKKRYQMSSLDDFIFIHP
jgi:hypothetical protein